jgi:hypothetical protein
MPHKFAGFDMMNKSKDELRLTKTELVRLVIQGPAPSRVATASAERILAGLTEGAPIESRISKITASLRGQFHSWFDEDQRIDPETQKLQLGAMLSSIGELIDLVTRRARV